MWHFVVIRWSTRATPHPSPHAHAAPPATQARLRLPKEVKGLGKGQLRKLLRLAKMPDQQCTERPQLIARLKEVEARARNGSGGACHTRRAPSTHALARRPFPSPPTIR